MSRTCRLVLRPVWDLVVEETSTPQDVEAETDAGYFRQWQGDNERLNAHLAHWRRINLAMETWRQNRGLPYPLYESSLLLYEERAKLSRQKAPE